VFVNVQKHPVVQVLLVKFVCQVVLQPSKARKWPLCCSIDIGTIKSGPSPGFRCRWGAKTTRGNIFKYNIGYMQQPGVQTWN